MTEPADVELIDVLRARDGRWTDVHLHDGRILKVLNIAWGYDEGDEHAHVTTNIGPDSEKNVIPDVFFKDEVSAVVDPDTSQRLYKAPGSDDA